MELCDFLGGEISNFQGAVMGAGIGDNRFELFGDVIINPLFATQSTYRCGVLRTTTNDASSKDATTWIGTSFSE